MYYYKRTEPGLWTVGCDDAQGKWHPESDHGSPEEARQRTAYLNGGGVGVNMIKIYKLIDSYWKFDEHQQPMSSWHDKQDLLKELEKL